MLTNESDSSEEFHKKKLRIESWFGKKNCNDSLEKNPPLFNRLISILVNAKSLKHISLSFIFGM
jgi:hypothetical protein